MSIATPRGLERKAAALRALRYESSGQCEIDRAVDFAIRVGIDPWKGFQTATTTRPGLVRSNRDRTYDVCYWCDDGRKVVREITGEMNGKQVAEIMARKLNQSLRKRLEVPIISGTARPPHMKGVHIRDLVKKSEPTA